MAYYTLAIRWSRKSNEVMMQLTLLALILGFGLVLGQYYALTDLGVLVGKSFTTRKNKTVAGFLGIPYAKPPIGSLRFKDPQRNTDKFDDPFIADTDSNMCLQLNDDGKVVGDEDCLYLNVYAPPKSDSPLPTMVYFHGGFFVRGSASSIEAGPEYLLDRDIVLVTVNYRLGPLGFLSTGDIVAPGNYGLKDQTLALRWIKDNIENFHGDSGRMTIFGNDAGGSSVILHALYKSNTGLFRNYISQSGTSISIWAFDRSTDPMDHAQDLAKLVNCPTSDSEAIVDCLREVDANSLVDSNDIFKNDLWPMRSWTPTIENEHANGFIISYPIQEVMYGKRNKMRGIVGTVKDEGLWLTSELYRNPKFYDKVANNVDAYVKYFVDELFNEDIDKKYYDQLKERYFGGIGANDKDALIKAFTKFITDIAFRLPANFEGSNMCNESEDNIFFYEFEYRGSSSNTESTIGSDKNFGIAHSDDMRYIFPTKNSPDLSSDDEKMIEVMLDFWTSFATTGTPTSQALPELNIWKNYAKENGTALRIGEKSDPMAIEMFLEMDEIMAIWTELVHWRIFESYVMVLTTHEL